MKKVKNNKNKFDAKLYINGEESSYQPHLLEIDNHFEDRIPIVIKPESIESPESIEIDKIKERIEYGNSILLEIKLVNKSIKKYCIDKIIYGEMYGYEI